MEVVYYNVTYKVSQQLSVGSLEKVINKMKTIRVSEGQ